MIFFSQVSMFDEFLVGKPSRSLWINQRNDLYRPLLVILGLHWSIVRPLHFNMELLKNVTCKILQGGNCHFMCVCVFRVSYLPEWVFWNVHVKTPSLDGLDGLDVKPWFLQACLQNQSSEYEISGVYPGFPSCGCLVGRFGEPQDPRRSDLSVTGPQDFPPAGNGSLIVNPSFLVVDRPSLLTFNYCPFLVIIGDYYWVNYIGFVALKENRSTIGQLLCWSSVFFAASAASASVPWLWCHKAAPVSSWLMKSSLQHSSTEYAEYTVVTLKQRWSMMPIYLAHDWRKKKKQSMPNSYFSYLQL